jgi:GntR family transcriptional regulator
MANVKFEIDHRSLIPRYHQIKENISQLLEDGQLQPGDPLPGENELSERYGVSRLTVRQALGDLVKEGLLVRRQGVGTFVAPRKSVEIRPTPLSFSALMVKAGLVPSSQVKSLREVPASHGVALRLRLSEGDPLFEVVRVRLINGEPVMKETTHLPALESEPLHQSLYAILAEKYDVVVTRVEQMIEPILMTDYDAQLLNSEQGNPALMMATLAWDQHERAVQTSKSVLRGDVAHYYTFYSA